MVRFVDQSPKADPVRLMHHSNAWTLRDLFSHSVSLAYVGIPGDVEVAGVVWAQVRLSAHFVEPSVVGQGRDLLEPP